MTTSYGIHGLLRESVASLVSSQRWRSLLALRLWRIDCRPTGKLLAMVTTTIWRLLLTDDFRRVNHVSVTRQAMVSNDDYRWSNGRLIANIWWTGAVTTLLQQTIGEDEWTQACNGLWPFLGCWLAATGPDSYRQPDIQREKVLNGNALSSLISSCQKYGPMGDHDMLAKDAVDPDPIRFVWYCNLGGRCEEFIDAFFMASVGNPLGDANDVQYLLRRIFWCEVVVQRAPWQRRGLPIPVLTANQTKEAILWAINDTSTFWWFQVDFRMRVVISGQWDSLTLMLLLNFSNWLLFGVVPLIAVILSGSSEY